MDIKTCPHFDKAFKKLILANIKLRNRFQSRLQLFINDPRHPLLRNHQLSGTMRKYHSFSLAGDIRIIYQLISPTEVILYDIGTHNQVY